MDIRYVGWTVKSPESRLREHIKDSLRARTHKRHWILSLVSIGLRPLIEVIETGSGDGWQEAERRWIAYYRGEGFRLTNTTDGGEGIPGYKHTRTFEQLSISAKKANQAQTPEERSARQKLAWANRTPENREEAAQRAKDNWTAIHAGRTPEQRSEVMKRAAATLTPEQLSARVKKRWANTSPEKRAAFIDKMKVSQAKEKRSAATHSWQDAVSAEQRSASAHKAWVKRRAASA